MNTHNQKKEIKAKLEAINEAASEIDKIKKRLEAELEAIESYEKIMNSYDAN